MSWGGRSVHYGHRYDFLAARALLYITKALSGRGGGENGSSHLGKRKGGHLRSDCAGKKGEGPKDEMKWEEEEERGKGHAICRKGDNLQKYGISSWAHSGGQRKGIKKSIRKTYLLFGRFDSLFKKYISAP